jgi:hypothetical protein
MEYIRGIWLVIFTKSIACILGTWLFNKAKNKECNQDIWLSKNRKISYPRYMALIPSPDSECISYILDIQLFITAKNIK